MARLACCHLFTYSQIEADSMQIIEIKLVNLPDELAVLPIDEEETLKQDITDEDKLIYVCRGNDD